MSKVLNAIKINSRVCFYGNKVDYNIPLGHNNIIPQQRLKKKNASETLYHTFFQYFLWLVEILLKINNFGGSHLN